MPSQQARTVAVVGAGASGLITTKTLMEAGVSVTTFEAGSQVGGLWVFQNDSGLSSAYRTLHINTDRKLTAFKNFPFPADTQPYPDHRDMAAYFQAYAERHDLLSHITFSTWIDEVVPLDEGRWEVVTRTGERHEFDAVVIATGHLSTPHHVAKFQAFDGEYVHAHYYREPDAFVGKRICVVGVGNSAADISTDICMQAKSLVLVARSGAMIRPKFIWGLAFTDIGMKFQRPWIPRKVRGMAIRWLTMLAHGRMETLGFRPLTARTHPTSNGTLVHHIRYQHIQVKHDIDRIDGATIRFNDGTSEEFDTLIAATGYQIDVPQVAGFMPIKDNHLGLYQRVVSTEWPGLYFIGFVNTPDVSLNYAFERQAEWLGQHLSGRAVLPGVPEMEASIAAKRAWLRAEYPDTPRHQIEEEGMIYTRDLRRSLLAAYRRAGTSVPKSHAVHRKGLGSII
jgi:dimethylaniline monooxygenase (N-oxide forming)